MAKKIITRGLLRLLPDAANRAHFVDSLTTQTPVIWRGNYQRWDVALACGLQNNVLTSDDQLIDLTGSALQSLTVEVKQTLDPAADRLMAQTVTVFDDTLTAAGWNAQTNQHATFLFSDSEANLTPGTYYLILSGIITGAGPYTFGVTEFTVQEDGTPGNTDDPAPNPGSAISLEQADARYAALGADSATSKRGTQALTSGASGAIAVAFGTAFAAAPSQVLGTLRIPSGGDTFAVNIDDSTVTTTGFSLVIPAGLTIPATGYKFDWLAFL